MTSILQPPAIELLSLNDDLVSENVVTCLHSGCQLQHNPTAFEQGLSVVICTYKRANNVIQFLDSLRDHESHPQQLIIVDASPDDKTEQAINGYKKVDQLADCFIYFRVAGKFKGLTRQRNFSLRWVVTDLTLFFDDDVILQPQCLQEMERVYRTQPYKIVGVGAVITNELIASPDRLWRIRRMLNIVSTLQPGRYCRSGMSIPWSFLQPTEAVVSVEWLRGAAMMWQTDILREVGFYSGFEGYAQGEDLDISLQMSKFGKLVQVGSAHILHQHEESGRPDHFKLGYMAIYNRYQIHRRGLVDRTGRDVVWFIYAWLVDTFFLLRHLIFPSRWQSTILHIAGRIKATYQLLKGQ
ncbi:MAG: glycosyltransferase family 2 protein [Chloroflexota bacterium]